MVNSYPNTSLFCLFLSFSQPNDKCSTKITMNGGSIDGVLGCLGFEPETAGW